jgi:predicted nuclease of predicted toxin-antitoxin system
MNFVVDQNLPAWLAGWLRDTGHDAVHLREIGMQAAMDDEVAALVRARSAVLITKDGDFARPPGPGALSSGSASATPPMAVSLRFGQTSGRMWSSRLKTVRR